jgi:hypothetical protein
MRTWVCFQRTFSKMSFQKNHQIVRNKLHMSIFGDFLRKYSILFFWRKLSRKSQFSIQICYQKVTKNSFFRNFVITHHGKVVSSLKQIVMFICSKTVYSIPVPYLLNESISSRSTKKLHGPSIDIHRVFYPKHLKTGRHRKRFLLKVHLHVRPKSPILRLGLKVIKRE